MTHSPVLVIDAARLDGSAPGPLKSGQISLQTEGAEVFYRDVEIRSITAVPGTKG